MSITNTFIRSGSGDRRATEMEVISNFSMKVRAMQSSPKGKFVESGKRGILGDFKIAKDSFVINQIS